MSNSILRYLVFCFAALLLTIGTLSAQDYITVVKLNDGSVFEGQLTEYVEGEYIKMDLGHSEITIKASSIKQIRHRNLKVPETSYDFEEKGLYHHTSVGLLPGYLSANNAVIGMEIDHTSGFLFNRYLGTGLNIGVHNYNPASREVIYSLAAEMRGYLLANNLSPYYLLRTGYGYAHKGEGFEEARGGFFFNPGIGFRFGGRKSFNFTAEFGLQFQDAFLKYENTSWWDRGVIEKEVRYQRFNLKIGLLF